MESENRRPSDSAGLHGSYLGHDSRGIHLIGNAEKDEGLDITDTILGGIQSG